MSVHGQPQKGRVVFIGAVHEAEPALAALLESGVAVAAVFTLPPEKAASVSGLVDLVPLASRHRVPIHHVANINDEVVVERIRCMRPDLLIVVGWTRLLGPQLLAVPSRGCVGFHASLLPKHRGRAPVNWAIIRGETITGNTMFMLEPEADTGDIVDQRAVTIAPDDTCADVYAKVAEAGAGMLRTHVHSLLAGTAPRMSQALGTASPLPKRTPAMGITAWDRPARAVHDWIRAMTLPYPGAFALLQGRKLMLWRSAVPGPREPDGTPGRILACSEDGLRIGTRGGSILVTEISDQGEPPEPALQWFQRSGLRAGVDFDPVDADTARWALGATLAPAAVRP